MDLAARKTACLFSGCARLGAVLGRAHRRGTDAGRLRPLRRRGFSAGGRSAGFHGFAHAARQARAERFEGGQGHAAADLCAAKAMAPRDVGMVRTVLEEKGFHTVRPEEISALVRDSGALDRTRGLAHEYATRAKACLNGRARKRIWPRAVRRSRFHPRPRTLRSARHHAAVQARLPRRLRSAARASTFFQRRSSAWSATPCSPARLPILAISSARTGHR